VAVPLTDLSAGHVFPEVSFVIDAATVSAYRDAVADDQPAYASTGNAVPPLAVVALALGALLKETELPPGSLHASESVAAQRVVHAGERVVCRSTLTQRSLRAGFVVSVLDTALSVDGEVALTARATVLSPQPS
jgi:N-terminal half of MaoC dehydratase